MFTMRVSQVADTQKSMGTPAQPVDFMTVTLSPPDPAANGESCGQFVLTILKTADNLKKYQYGATVPVTL